MVTPRNGEHPAVRKYITFGYLGTGALALCILAWALVFTADVPTRAAWFYTGFGGAAVLLAGFLGVPWSDVVQHMSTSASGSEGFGNWLRRRAKRFASRAARIVPASPRATRVRSKRVIDYGLWIPFLILLGAVGALIQFSGGVVHSPFSPVPAIVLTLVVLLIGPAGPGSEAVIDEEVAVARNPDAGDEEVPFPGSILLLFLVAGVFYAAMIALNHWLPDEPHAREGATLAVSIATTLVGITFAMIARWDELTGAAPPG
jgi:hypothetical protein